MTFTRRHALGLLGVGGIAATAPIKLAFAEGGRDQAENRLLVVFLRGAMDGLAAVPPYGDPDFETARAGIALPPPGEEGGVLKLDAFFGLNPLLPTFHAAWRAGEMSVVHAVASPYRERSHFDAQNLIENGTLAPYGAETGWLNRAIVDIPIKGDVRGVSVTRAVPVIMRGPASITSWSPSSLPQPDAGLIARASMLYDSDENLARFFDSARQANAGMAGGADHSGFAAMMAGAARFLKDPGGPRVAFTSSGGWDTHAGQSAVYGPLWQAMTSLDGGLAAFRQEVGDEVWSKTAIVFVTEFGRTVAMNGSNGTDHGTAGALFLVGGAVKGGQIHTDWPGLKASQLYEGRDLMPTRDMRSVFKGLLSDHLGVSAQRIESDVFADSAGIDAMSDLLRG